MMYVHCYAHCLNLTLIDAECEKNSKKVVKNRLIFNFLGTIQYVHNYIESSPMRHSTLEKVSKETGVTLLTLKSCSIIQWACRAEAVKAIKNNYNVLITAIDEICENTSVTEMRAKGIGISQQLQTFEFIFGMELMSPILNIILKVSSILQSPKIDLLIAAECLNTLKNTLLNMRNIEEEYKIIFSNTEKMCTMHKINIPEIKERKVTTKIDPSPSNQVFFKTKYEELKISVYYPLLDDLISGINSRLKQDTICLINAVANIINLNITTEIATVLEKFAKISSDTLIAEIKLLKNSADKNIPKGTTNESVFLWLDWLKDSGRYNIFNCFFKILQMFCIIPVTSCSCERVFSKLNIVKSKLRNTIAQDRLESLILLFTEQEMASNVEDLSSSHIEGINESPNSNKCTPVKNEESILKRHSNKSYLENTTVDKNDTPKRLYLERTVRTLCHENIIKAKKIKLLNQSIRRQKNRKVIFALKFGAMSHESIFFDSELRDSQAIRVVDDHVKCPQHLQ
ncbi:hypothetical protein QTP88_019633 [Uroleucon formosanum]